MHISELEMKTGTFISNSVNDHVLLSKINIIRPHVTVKWSKSYFKVFTPLVPLTNYSATSVIKEKEQLCFWGHFSSMIWQNSTTSSISGGETMVHKFGKLSSYEYVQPEGFEAPHPLPLRPRCLLLPFGILSFRCANLKPGLWLLVEISTSHPHITY